MVAFAREEKQTETGVICPKCFRELAGKLVLPTYTDRYKRIIREYYGWCDKCDVGFEVVQFKMQVKGGWRIHKYRLYRACDQDDKPIPTTGWLIVNHLPEPAPVVTGPGGEYDKSFTPETIELVETVLTALKATVKTVESLLKLAKQEK